MNAHGAVPLGPPEPRSYEEAQREFTVQALAEVWHACDEAVGLPPSREDDVTTLFRLLYDGADEEVCMALLPRPEET